MGSIGLPEFNVFGDYSNIINGKLSSTKETRHSLNPATEQPNAEVPVSTKEDVDAAVAAAGTAFKTWSKTSLDERKKAILAFADTLEKYSADFAKLLTQEQGKPAFLAQQELTISLSYLRTFPDLKFEEEVLEDSDEKKVITRYTPLGVGVGIVPWNFPVNLAVNKIAPAVLTGNTVIIKPSPFTPYSALKIVELIQQFLPPGVVQALSGDDNLGPWLTAHPDVAKISFTGSTFTGKKVMESAAKTLKRVTLELGGNDPTIVCGDVDISAVAPKVATLAFLNSGQICIAIKRIYVHESIFEKFRDAVVAVAQSFKVGAGDAEGTFVGPITNKMQFDKVQNLFSDIEKEKWNAVLGGKNEEKPGYFITPTIIDRPAEDSRIVTEEPFGPIVPMLSWSSEEDVVARANNTKMGLGASVWSNDLEQADRIARQLEAGTVWVNSHLELDAKFPFGGHKESGLGVELGVAGLRSWCNIQTISLRKK